MADRLNATFFAFQKRESGGVLLRASVAYAIALVLSYAVFIAIAWFAVDGAAFMTWYNEVMAAEVRGETYGEPPPNALNVLMMAPLLLVWVFAAFVLLAAYESACVRWMLRGDKSAPLQLHFGADMWRVYGTYWFWLVYSLITCVIFVVVMAVIGIAAGNSGVAGPWIALAATVLALVAWLYTTVRLSPASATSIAIGEFSPFKAWSVSSGRFWALFGAYLLLFILYIVVAIVVGLVTLGSYYSQVFGGLDWTLAQTDSEAFMRAYEQASLAATQQMFSNPTSIALYIGSQLAFLAVALVFYVLWFGVESRAAAAALDEGKIEKAAPES